MPQTKKNNKPKLSLQDILDQLPGHIYWKDKDGILLGCNSKTWQDFGSSSLKDYIGKTDYDLFPEAQADELVKTDREVIRTGKISIVEEFADLIDDSTALFLSHKAPLRDKAGETVGTIGVSLNVTKSKQEELERLNLLDNIIALMPEHVYWKDKKGKYLGCNDVQAHALKLKSRQEIVNKTPYENLSKKDAEMLQKIDAEVLEQGKVVTREEPGIREDGSEGVFLTKKVPLYDNEKNIAGLLGISFDITERKQTEKKLKKAMADAKVANRLKSEFIANMEHDIRTPCSGIAGTVNILEEKETDKTKKETLGYVKKAACNLLDLLNSIITFDLVESGRLPVIDKKFNIRSLIDSVVALETPTAKLKEVDLTTHCDDEIPKILIGDDYRLQRILINLVSNAIKFTKKGYVKIIVNIAQDYDDKTIILDITVKDTGIGIP
ncbi:MAG: PAS domain-containing protein, partial [Gammaproteobacteria bacterium]|nr:PAS domain-containing protein [Gammaproteobacteria bacterium]